MGKNFLRSICFASLAMATANASTIQIRPSEYDKLMEVVRSADKSWDRQLKELGGTYIVDAAKGRANEEAASRKSSRSSDRNREPEPNLTPLNRPISLWNSVHDLREPVAARIAVLNDEPVRLWNAVGNSERLALVWRDALDDGNVSTTSLLSLSGFDGIGFRFAGGNAQGSILNWWEEWSSRNVTIDGDSDGSDSERCSLLGSMHYPTVDIGHAIPDGGATIYLLGTALVVLHLFRRKQALA